MSRNSGKRPHELTLELFAKGAVQTPSEIDAFVGNGPYASKHIWFLRKLGHDITINKNGRTVVSYVYNGVGTATAVAPKPAKVAKAKPAKVAVPAVAKTKAVKSAAASFMAKRKADAVTKQFGSSGEVSSFGVDADWDSMEGVDVKSLVA